MDEITNYAEVLDKEGHYRLVFDSRSIIPLKNIENGTKLNDWLNNYQVIVNKIRGFDGSLYREKSVSIQERDLSDDLKEKINKKYDDTYIRKRLSILEVNTEKKVDEVDLGLYRKKSVPITKYDLSDDLLNFIVTRGNDDEDYNEMIKNIFKSKADKVEVGSISDVNDTFYKVSGTTKGDQLNDNIINVLNFLVENCISTYSAIDYGSIMDDVSNNQKFDYGSITGEVVKTSDYGKIIENKTFKID